MGEIPDKLGTPPPKFTGPYIWGDQIFWVALGVAVKWIKLVQGKKEASAWKKRLLAGYLDPPPGEMWVPFVFSNSLADGVKRSICAVGCQKGLCEKRVHDLGGGAATMEMQFHIHSQKVKALTEFHALAHQKKVGVAKWALFNAAWKGVQEAEISG